MIDLKGLRENPGLFREKLARRGSLAGLEELIRLDEDRRKRLSATENLQRERKERSREIGLLQKEGAPVDELKEKVRQIGDELKKTEGELKAIDGELSALLLGVPNLPDDAVPDGASENENREIRRIGEPSSFPFSPRPHHELGEALGVLDLPRAAKLAGARFSLLVGDGAKLERALINFMLAIHTKEHGYTEIIPPVMVNGATMTGTGQLPKFADDLFKIEGADQWLIPTAEVPLTNIYADEIIEPGRLPINLTAFTPCFRAEAGSYGKDTTGLIRLHQFNKVELVKIVAPDEGKAELDRLLGHAEVILRALDLPYRVVSLCAGDLGFSASLTYDIEVWVPSQNTYREISSCSLFTDFQARRMNMRYRPENSAKPAFPYTINGSGLAVGRTMVAILENFQNEDGSVTIPEALRPFMDGQERIARP